MDDQTTESGNQTQETVSDGNDTTIESIMGGMADSTAPESQPTQADSGDKEEGTDNSQQKTQDKSELPAWMQQLPDELRNDKDIGKQLSKFQKIGDMAKAYSELESKLGKSLIQPSKDASPEEIQQFYEKLGKPKSAKDYSLPEENTDVFRDIAFKNNLSDEQAKSVYDAFKQIGNDVIKQQQVNLSQQAKATTDKLKTEYGNQFNTKMEMLKRGVQNYGGSELGNLLKASGLLANETVCKMFIKLGEQTAEAGTKSRTTSEGNTYKSDAEGGRFTFKGLDY